MWATPLVVANLVAGRAAAAPDAADKAAAESLFQAAKKLMEQERYAEACPKLAESQRLDPSTGTLINLARCHEREGKTASAWAEYKEVAVLAQTQGQTERAAAARDLAAKLEPRLSRLRIDAPPVEIPELVVTRNGVAVGKAMLGTPIAVDPGEQRIAAVAPGYREWSSQVVVGREADEKTVALPALERLGASAAAGPGGAASTEDAARAAPAEGPEGDERARSGPSKLVPYVLLGVGAVGLGVGAWLGLAAKNQSDEAAANPALCPDKRCSAEGMQAIDGARSKATLSTVAVGVGVVALGVGVAWLVLAPGASDAAGKATGRAHAHLHPALGPEGGGVWITGGF